MEAGCKFSGGTAKANLILSTGFLQRAWTSISQFQQLDNHHLPFIVDDRFRNFTIVAFSDLQNQTQDLHLLPPFLAPLQQTHPEFGFLITKDNPSVSFHASPLSTFLRLLRTTDLKAQLERLTESNKPQLILAGQSLGGSVAALCTLWLLRNQPSPSLPLCITFGSPLIGDDGLWKGIAAVEQWKAQFWHVAAHDDIIPRLYASRPAVQNSYYSLCKPFGTYFLISDSGCACADHPDSVVELLDLTSPNFDELPKQLQPKNYGILLKQLEKKPLRKSRNIEAAAGSRESLVVDLTLQLDAVGIGFNHMKHQELLQTMKEREKEAHLIRSSMPHPSKRLSDVKKQMARLEWYKKECEMKNTTYYDCYKSRSTEKDIDVIKFKNILNNYWKEKVEEAENKPQLPDARLSVRWLFGGVTYKRMVEPLEIADHYRKTGRRDYMAKRPRYYEILDKWHEEDDKKNKKVKRKTEKGASLTDDSCFWAHVEEAALWLNELQKQGKIAGGKREELWTKLRGFEGYVMKLVDNYELSTEAFLDNSSFMEWWMKYEKELEPGYSSKFVAFMKDGRYVHYK